MIRSKSLREKCEPQTLYTSATFAVPVLKQAPHTPISSCDTTAKPQFNASANPAYPYYTKMHPPLFHTVESNWQPPKLCDLPDWSNAKRVAIDTETKDPNLKTTGPGGGRTPDSYITGISFSIEDGPSHYLPIRHQGGDNLPVEEVLRYMAYQATNFKGILVGANLGYDLDFLASDDIRFTKVKFFRDIQVADPLLYELHQHYSMGHIAARWGEHGKNEDLLRAAAQEYSVDPKSGMWQLPARFVGAYAEQDAVLPLNILRKQEREIDKKNLWQIYDLESRLLPLLVKLRRRGVRIDTKHLDYMEAWALAEEKQMLKNIHTETGRLLSLDQVTNPRFLAPVFDAIGVTMPTTTTGKASVDREWMKTQEHPVVRFIERARKINKLRNTFVASVRKHMINGRIHCTFNQLRMAKEEGGLDSEESQGAAFGRLSCQNPNLQQQPAREDYSAMWRAIYLPEEGQLWASNDFSSQEPRMAIHVACRARSTLGQEAWETAIAARDTFRRNPRTDNHAMTGEMIYGRPPTKTERSHAKTVFLGLCYGMGGAKLCKQIGLPTRWVVRNLGLTWEERMQVFEYGTPEADALIKQGQQPYEAAGEEGQRFLELFDQKVPYVKKLAKAVESKAKRIGEVKTYLGRLCHFPQDQYGNYEWTHKALNRVIQGSGADQTKKAMLDLDAAGFDIMIQVHDEIAMSVNQKSEAEEAARIMEHTIELEVPTVVDVEIGESWGHSMGYGK